MVGVDITTSGDLFDKFAKDANGLYSRLLNAVVNGINDSAYMASADIMWDYATSEEELSDLHVSVSRANAQDPAPEAVITAQAEQIVFAEFGAGTLTGYGATADALRNVAQDGLYVYPGSWSATEGTGQFVREGYWVHEGQRYEYIRPTAAMSNAASKLRRDLPETIRGALK